MNLHFRWSQTAKSESTAVRLRIPKAHARGISIPAWRAADGTHICHGASTCIKPCYAQDGRFRLKSVKERLEHNLALFRSGMDWTPAMLEDIDALRLEICRIHDSGDFFDANYFARWMWVAKQRPNVRFYGYTKDIPLLDKHWERMPDNLRIAQSYGGKWDDRIVTERSHAKVFPDLASLRAANYSDASHDDVPTVRGARKIGLVVHGQKASALLRRGQLGRFVH